MNQTMSQAKDIYFDTDIIKASSVRKHGAASAHFFSVARYIPGFPTSYILLGGSVSFGYRSSENVIKLNHSKQKYINNASEDRIPELEIVQ